MFSKLSLISKLNSHKEVSTKQRFKGNVHLLHIHDKLLLQDPSEIQVLVKILDIDDHLPQFENINMTVGVRLNVPIDALIATVKATDKDPDARPINYSVVNMTFESPIKGKSLSNISDVIALNNVTGDLKIMRNLIHYPDGIFRFVCVY